MTLSAPPIICSSPIIDLTSSDPSIADVPQTLTFAGGTTTAQFTVTTTSVSNDTNVQITASDGAGNAVGTLIVDAQSSTPPAASGGTILAWGRNDEGELGNGTTSSFNPLPTAVSNLSGVTNLAAGDRFSIALKSDGSVWAWGANSSHQLGDGTNSQSDVPVQVQGLANITAISARRLHSLALDNNGNVWAWGENGSGQLGDGATNNAGSEPSAPVQVQGLDHVIAIAAGGFFSIALKDDGTVWTWGANDAGQLGDGTTTPSDVPVQVTGVSGTTLPKFTMITAGFHHVLAVDENGNLWSWGGNENGTLGIGSADSSAHVTPVQLTGISNVTALAAYYNQSLAVSGGNVFAWGNNAAGELGDGTQTNHYSPIQVPGLSNIINVAVGGYHSLALTGDGTVYAWGDNGDGRLGDNTSTAQFSPVPVLDPSGASTLSGVTLIAAGDRVSLALVGTNN